MSVFPLIFYIFVFPLLFYIFYTFSECSCFLPEMDKYLKENSQGRRKYTESLKRSHQWRKAPVDITVSVIHRTFNIEIEKLVPWSETITWTSLTKFCCFLSPNNHYVNNFIKFQKKCLFEQVKWFCIGQVFSFSFLESIVDKRKTRDLQSLLVNKTVYICSTSILNLSPTA